MKLKLKKEHLMYVWLTMAASSAHAQKYNFSHKWGGNGTANGKTSYPVGIAINSSGNICVSEAGNNRIELFSPAGAFLSKWGSTGSGNGQFQSPGKIAMDSDDNTYVCDQNNGDRIQKINSAGAYVSQWGGNGSDPGEFNFLAGIATDASNNVYAVDYFNARIQKFDASGTFITSWGSAGNGDGQFSGLQDIAVGTTGNVFVIEYDNNRVQKFDAAGTFIAKWGSFGTGSGQFDGVSGIALDANDNVYVIDYGNNRIQKFNSDGSFITQWGSFGVADGKFNGPADLAVDAIGNVYVCDQYNHRIQVFAEETSTSWDGTSWSNGFPTAFMPAKINANYAGAAFECTSLIINEGVTLTINAGQYVTATDVNTIGTGKIVLNEGGSLNYNTYTGGNITVNKTASTGRYLMLAPLKSNIGGSKLPASTDTYYYDETARTATDYSTGWIAGTDGDNSSTGYAVYNTGSFSINGLLPYTSLPISIPVTKSAIAPDDAKNGWNLIGNTTTCPLNLLKFLTLGANPTIINGGAVYVWDGANYIAKNLGKLASFQGFFVKANSTSIIEISQNMFSIANVGLLRTEDENETLTLEIAGNGKKDQTQVDFKADASDLYSIQNDALKFSLEATALSLASKIAGNNNHFAINTVSPIGFSNKSIPLVYTAQKAGTYTLSLSNYSVSDLVFTTLVDNELKKTIPITKQSYSFQSGVVTNSSRFSLLIGPATITSFDKATVLASDIMLYVNNDVLYTQLTDSELNLQVLNLEGKEVYNGTPNTEMNISNWQSGIYMAKIYYKGRSVTKKIIKQ